MVFTVDPNGKNLDIVETEPSPAREKGLFERSQ